MNPKTQREPELSDDDFRQAMLQHTMRLARTKRFRLRAQRFGSLALVACVLVTITLRHRSRSLPVAEVDKPAVDERGFAVVRSVPFVPVVHTESLRGGVDLVRTATASIATTNRKSELLLVRTNPAEGSIPTLTDEQLLQDLPQMHAALVAAGTKQARLITYK